ncbi:nitroreductase family protein [Parahaliea maris]|uniref:Nitroreductase family protein n=1 Tax=Parahaliea maris TaxID=2716870 RepID=A0A5C9A862_9GAMM|nr:nitroreductase family protein [Parahaliea maris]TXS95860.1 nitroreductase family protein [Parahaliea maris]
MSYPQLDLSLDDLLATTRSVRKRLDLSRPVPRDLLTECIELAIQAPNGSNQQFWHWLVIDDERTRADVAAIYRTGMAAQVESPGWMSGIDFTGPDQQRIAGSVEYLASVLHEVPAIVIPVIEGRVEGGDLFTQASLWGSILPAAWNFMLALRSRGLGSAWTTVHLHRAAEMAECLGIPPTSTTQAGLFPVAYTLGSDFKRARRMPAEDITHWNHWRKGS